MGGTEGRGIDLDVAELVRQDKAHLWHPFTAQRDWLADPDPLVIVGGEGCELIDVEGRRYIDGVSSLWCNIHGHRHLALDAAIREQLDEVAHVTMLGLTHPRAVELASALVARAPEGLSRVFFSDDGATAVEAALKMAFQYYRQKPEPEPRRTRFIALANAYHGDTLGDVSLGGVERYIELFRPLLFPVLRAPWPHPYRHPGTDDPAVCRSECLEAVEGLLKAHEGEVVGVVVEPLVQGAAGMIVHPPGYLAGLRELTRRYDTMLIADEVAVGFGRTGTLFACQKENVAPDFLCLAKGITGGYLPLAATLTTERVFEGFVGDENDPKTFAHGHTYGGNPLGAAVALACLRVFDEERTLERLQGKIARLGEHLDRIGALEHVGNVRQCGLIAGIELVADRGTRASYPSVAGVGRRVCRRARDRGLVIRPLGDVLVVMPPLNIPDGKLDEMMSMMEECIVAETS